MELLRTKAASSKGKARRKEHRKKKKKSKKDKKDRKSSRKDKDNKDRETDMGSSDSEVTQLPKHLGMHHFVVSHTTLKLSHLAHSSSGKHVISEAVTDPIMNMRCLLNRGMVV